MIGICVVYLVQDPEGYDVLDFSIAQLKKTTQGAFNIYGCCPQRDPVVMERLKAHEIIIIDAPESGILGAYQHAQLLNILVERAVRDGCKHIATFDMDSWPIISGWDKFYAAKLNERTPVAAIVRSELQDNFPFPAFIMMNAPFWRPAKSSFSTLQTRPYDDKAASLSTRPEETGSGILMQLRKENRHFLRIEKTNVVELHPVIAACYGNTVFHLGAGSRNAQFITDNTTYRLDRSSLLRTFATHMNRAVRAYVIQQILYQHDKFISMLIGTNFKPREAITTYPGWRPSPG